MAGLEAAQRPAEKPGVPVALGTTALQWTSPAWTMAARDRWIGWNSRQRARNLQYIVNNSRFLILPWVQVKGLASAILSRAAKHLKQDWRLRYGYTPLLLETLVDATRFKGTCYRAANWICVGQTTGRGRMDRHHLALATNTKLIFVFPLQKKTPLLRSALFRGNGRTFVQGSIRQRARNRPIWGGGRFRSSDRRPPSHVGRQQKTAVSRRAYFGGI